MIYVSGDQGRWSPPPMGSVRGARAGPYRPPTGPQRRKGDQEGLYGVYATLGQPRRRGPFHRQSVSGAATGVMSMNSLDRLARPSDLLMEVGSSQRDSDGYAENTDPATNLHQLVRSPKQSSWSFLMWSRWKAAGALRPPTEPQRRPPPRAGSRRHRCRHQSWICSAESSDGGVRDSARPLQTG